MIHGLPESEWIAPGGMRRPGEPFVIGYAGSLYARREWDALIAALSSTGWRIAGRDVRIRVLASSFDVKVTGPVRVELLGWHATTDAVRLLAECDICYVPYWFDDACRSAVELSFPNKMSLYFAAGRPVLFHGPRHSTPVRFLERYPAGVTCHSLDEQSIVAALGVAASDAGMHAKAAEAIPRALAEELSARVFRTRFAEFLGVAPSALQGAVT
jgi:glycosyltransferase involved in cell wall biosynthesis